MTVSPHSELVAERSKRQELQSQLDGLQTARPPARLPAARTRDRHRKRGQELSASYF